MVNCLLGGKYYNNCGKLIFGRLMVDCPWEANGKLSVGD